jgi:conjugal transfer ATP-binding protein TraC
MKQKSEVIDKNLNSGALSRFSSDPFFVKSLKDIQTLKGKYSEILITGERMYESVRLYVPPFTAALFSTDGAARDTVFELMQSGMSAVEAVRLVLADEAQNRQRWLDAIVYKLHADRSLGEWQFIEEFKAACNRHALGIS